MAKPSPVRCTCLVLNRPWVLDAAGSFKLNAWKQQLGLQLPCRRGACSHTALGPALPRLPTASSIPGPHIPRLPPVRHGAVSAAGALLISEPAAIAFSTYGFVIHPCQWIICRAQRHARVNGDEVDLVRCRVLGCLTK